MKRAFPILVIAAAYLFVSCTKGGVPDTVSGNRYDVTSNASARQLVPAIDTSSSGSLKGLYDEDANVFTYTLSWDDLWRDSRRDTIISISFYGGATSSSNGVLIRTLPFVNPNRTGSINLGLLGNNGLREKEKADFLAGSYYFTINTKRFSTGIIRGQLAVKKQ